MDKKEKIEEIDRKCRMAGCNEDAARRHLRLFVYERWDVHPPDDFKAWLKENGQMENPIPAWNADSTRQEFYQSKGTAA